MWVGLGVLAPHSQYFLRASRKNLLTLQIKKYQSLSSNLMIIVDQMMSHGGDLPCLLLYGDDIFALSLMYCNFHFFRYYYGFVIHKTFLLFTNFEFMISFSLYANKTVKSCYFQK